jgi:hypothetical protein
VTLHGRKYRASDSHPMPLWSGIMEHCGRIGSALWEFVWCLDKITEDRDGIGIVLGGTGLPSNGASACCYRFTKNYFSRLKLNAIDATHNRKIVSY